MKKIIPTLTSLLAMLLLTSCFEQETKVYWKKDGTGTVDVLTRITGPMYGDIPDDASYAAQAEKEAKAAAADYGEGVTLVKFEFNKDTKPMTSRATYSFADINKLRIAMPTGMKHRASANIGGNGAAEEQSSRTNTPMCAFRHQDGVLTILQNKPKAGGGAPVPAGKRAPRKPEADEMIKQLLAGVKVSIKLVPEAGIAETNATHRDGDAITLFEVDADKWFANPENIRKLDDLGPDPDPATLQKARAGVDGVKVETKPEILVKSK